MKVMNIDATYGRIVFSDHEDERGTAYLYGIENDDGDVSLIRLDRAQRRTLAIALLGYDEQFVNDYGATIPSARETQVVPKPDEWEETQSEYRPYENDPTLSAPPITDADAPEVDDYQTLYTQDDIDKAVLAADQSAFERGYAGAVDDYRHGLWADEVEDTHQRLESARFNETSFRTTLLDVQEWMNEVEDIEKAVGHDRILDEVNETLA